MGEIWSKNVQGINTLYLSRQLRFADERKEKYLSAFGIPDGAKILEIGCGPGALSQALARWYPNAEIIGSDYDSAFIEFAKKQAPSIEFIEADATALPFEENTFDVTISHTVQEHVDPEKFFSEQYRVLKKGGVILVLSARRGINHYADFIAEETDFEREIWHRVSDYYDKSSQEIGVGKYSVSEQELPLLMEKYGFREVSTEYLTVNLTPDSSSVTKNTALAIINENRQCALDAVNSIPNVAAGVVSEEELDKMRRIINEKHDKRVALYNEGEKVWDVNMSLTMVLRGIK